jgi:quercetin dioxygenase-like cupin family protein
MKIAAFVVSALSFVCVAASAQDNSANPLATAKVFAYDQMPAKTAPNGAVGRRIFTGTLATGESVGVHETLQPAGTTPNPPHRIQHSEIIVVQEGTLEFDHDGKTERAEAGSVIYVAMGTLHTVKNIGNGPAQYVVIQIGGDTGPAAQR